LKVKSVTIDGEVAWLNEEGASDFNALHSRLYDESAPLCAFDLLELDGEDYRGKPLLDRKKALKKVLGKARGLQYVDHLKGDGQAIFEHVCRMGLEGIVSKRVDAPYRAGPSKSWLKIKNRTHPALMRVAEAKAR
jgi:bifunctional non-homologous end joining protein LigD